MNKLDAYFQQPGVDSSFNYKEWITHFMHYGFLDNQFPDHYINYIYTLGVVLFILRRLLQYHRVIIHLNVI